MKPIYHMSESGNCPKSLAASRLGYEPIKDNPRSERIMRSGNRHEKLIAQDLVDEDGLVILDAGACEKCSDEEHRHVGGHHVEIDDPLVRLVGHIDRIALIDEVQHPVEIKSMGLFAYNKFKKYGLTDGYKAQEACYLHAMQTSGLYVVRCRDDDETLKFTVGAMSIPGFGYIDLGISFDEVLQNIYTAELAVQEKQLPEGKETPLCSWCKFRYLCDKYKDEKKPASIVSSVSMAEAALMWKEGKSAFDEAEAKMEQAKATFLKYAKDNKVDKFTTNGLTVGYYGTRQNPYLDQKKLKELVPETVIKMCTKDGKTWEDIRIRQ